MDVIKRGLIFDGKAMVSVLDTTQLCEQAQDLHALNDASAHILGQALTVAAFMSVGLADEGNSLSISISNNGEAGKIVVAAEKGGFVRGYIQNKGLSSCETAIGEGFVEVIKDLGLKEPYAGKIALVGSIAKSFAYYFTISEQVPSALALGSDKRYGGVFIQALPDCTEEETFILEDSLNAFGDFSKLLEKLTPQEIIDFYYGHFGLKQLEDIYPQYRCNCKQEKIEAIILGLGEKEARNIVSEQGVLEVNCSFCDKNYRYNNDDLDKLFKGENGKSN